MDAKTLASEMKWLSVQQSQNLVTPTSLLHPDGIGSAAKRSIRLIIIGLTPQDTKAVHSDSTQPPPVFLFSWVISLPGLEPWDTAR